MLRNLAAALALTLVFQSAFGLGLGTLKQSSSLNEPFDARIEILGATAGDFDTVAVALANSEQFMRAGVNRDAVLFQLRFKIVEGAGGDDYIHITSHDPIREPFLNFLLELNWAKGRMVREYTVLLDPPLYDPVRRRVAAAPAAAAPVMAPEAEPMAAPEQEMAATMDEAADSAPVMSAEVEMAEPEMEAPTADAYSAGGNLGPVQLNDTLWSIASANLPSGDVSVQQMMLALLRANPEAFGSENINILKRGAILRMPEEADINALSRAEAIAEVKRQHQLWSGYRDIATETVAEEPIVPEADYDSDAMDDEPATADESSMDDSSMAVETPAEPEGQPRIELVAPDGTDDAMGTGSSDEGGTDVTLAREELDAQMQENEELQARITEANEIIELMERQVDIKDDELAALQSRLAELGIEPPEELMAEMGAEEADDVVEGAIEDSMDVADDTMATDEEAPMTDDTTMDDTVAAEDPMIDEPEVGVDDGLDEVDITIGEADTATDDEMAPAIDDGLAESETDDSMAGLDDGGGAQPDGGGLLDGLIPSHISNMVPGGAITILGILGAVLLGILVGLVKMLGGRSDDEAVAVAVAEETPTEFGGIDEDDEPITETREEGIATEIDSEDPTEAADDGFQATSPDFQATLEATADELLPEEPAEEDPLEEVNVYLAYERFDQAEELVRKVIEDHPDEHKYKLRLLEVFYSANNKAAYEEAAQTLQDAVGNDDPLWESAVAMWTEMSPERALFEEGAVEEAGADDGGDAANAFVDITQVEEDAGGNTMSMAPGGDSVLESTQVSLGTGVDDGDDAESSLDFDLGAADTAGDDVLDLTATVQSSADADDEMLDLTAGMEDPADAGDDGGMLDLTSDFDDAMSDGSGLGDDMLDLTSPDEGNVDLLDVTKTGDIGGDAADDILNVTSPSLVVDDEPSADADDAVTSADDDSGGIDFDISDTVTPVFQSDDDSVSPDDEESVFDITSPSTDDDDDDGTLDFDIGELEETVAGDDDETMDISGGLDFDSETVESLGDSLDLEIPETNEIQDEIETVEMDAITETALDLSDTGEAVDFDLTETTEADDLNLADTTEAAAVTEEAESGFDLSLQSPELDELSIADTVNSPESVEDGGESEIEFDLALQDTTEMDSLAIDETLELPKAATADESLEDLTKSMEESMADLDLGDDDLGETGELDMSLADTSGGLDFDFGETVGTDTETKLDFDLDGIDLEGVEQTDTVALDLSIEDDDEPGEDTTVVMPVDDNVEEQTDADEVDTKLNLAKAYIELGDNDGARSILDEVIRDGSDDQQSEAQRLIDQIG